MGDIGELNDDMASYALPESHKDVSLHCVIRISFNAYQLTATTAYAQVLVGYRFRDCRHNGSSLYLLYCKAPSDKSSFRIKKFNGNVNQLSSLLRKTSRLKQSSMR